jgi:Ca-activated chloride channel family protein
LALKTPGPLTALMGLLALAVFPATPPSLAASQAVQPEPRPSFSVDVSAVALDVVVTDARGRFVNGLKQEDFLVLDQGVPQRLDFFTADPTPVTVLVLLDSSASVRSKLREVQRAANRFITRLPRGDTARVGFFHDRVVFGPRFTSDMNEHVAMINQMRPQRSTHLYDALVASLVELAPVESRKALLVFTDGDDQGSKASVEEAFEAVRRSQVSVYAIGLLGWSSNDGMAINENLLTQVTEYSGGRAFFPSSDNEMRTAFDRISDELRRQYRIAYTPSDVKTEDGWHSIEVRITGRKDLVVRARLGYHRPQGTVQ